jgi:hypothetical protein
VGLVVPPEEGVRERMKERRGLCRVVVEEHVVLCLLLVIVLYYICNYRCWCHYCRYNLLYEGVTSSNALMNILLYILTSLKGLFLMDEYRT